MKTNIFFFKKATLYSLVGFLSVLVTSCGTYQNSSYYDTDGIYGNSPNEPQIVSSNQYKNYFKSLQENNEVVNDSVIKLPSQGYTETNVVNVYNDPWNMSFGMGWGMGIGWGYPGWGWGGAFGWGDPFFGFGWGYPGWGWGYPGWGWGNPGWGYPAYGYNNNYSYNSSRRGSSYAYDVNGNRYARNQSYTPGTTNYSNSRRGGSVDARNSSSFMTADYSQNSNSRSRGSATNSSNRGSNYSNNRTYNSNSNSYNNSSNSRSSAPSNNYNSSRSYNNYSGGGYSGGRSSGGGYSGGGGRSSGGGGVRR